MKKLGFSGGGNIMGKIQNTKKTIFFIVEGATDKTALEKIFKRIYRNKDIRFKFTNGDITSDDDITEDNVCDIIYSKVKKYIDDNKLKKTDIWQIVQIFDMDGTYIPETAITTGMTKEFVYSTADISCKYPENVKARNKKKSGMMEYLLSIKEIKNIPYIGYYMSSNLDHALYDKQNLTDEEKREYADEFYEWFEGEETLFIEFLKKYVVNGVPDSLPESWKYIKEDLRSLERHINLHIFFLQNPYL